MPGILIPNDRSSKQQARGYCLNPQCAEVGGERFEFDVDNAAFACPKCGNDSGPMTGLLVLTHLLVPHPRGPIGGGGGMRYKLACDERRAYLATTTNMEAATGVPEIANCPGCLVAWEQTGRPSVSGYSVCAKQG